MSTGIRCDKCGRLTVVASTQAREGMTTARRRHCSCGHRFTTIEVVVSERPRFFELSRSGRHNIPT